MKLEIRPDYDVEPVALIRQHFLSLPLVVGANSTYILVDLPQLQCLDRYQLAMIEQPFAAGGFLDRAQLQRGLKIRICLDESVRSLKDCQVALALGGCRSTNLKIPRVGGIHKASRIVAFCRENDLLVWLGGMFKSGVDHALNLQFTPQPASSFPDDISATERYLYEDTITKPLILG